MHRERPEHRILRLNLLGVSDFCMLRSGWSYWQGHTFECILTPSVGWIITTFPSVGKERVVVRLILGSQRKTTSTASALNHHFLNKLIYFRQRRAALTEKISHVE